SQMVLRNFGRAGWFQEIGTAIGRDNDPQPPAIANFAFHLGKDHPARLVPVPVVCCATSLKDARIKRLEKLSDSFQTPGEGPLRDRESLQRQYLPNPIQWPLKQELLQEKMNPEAAGKHTFGDELGDRRRCHDARDSPAITSRAVTGPFMNVSHQADFPVNLLGILTAGKDGAGLPADRATLLCFGQLMKDLFCGKPAATPAAIALRTGLFTAVVFTLGGGLRGVAGFLVTVVVFRDQVLRLLGLAAEQLLLQLSDPGFQSLDLLGQSFILLDQLRDLGLLLADHLFKLSRLFFPDSLAFDRTGMLCPPVVDLPAEFN
ncbi:hypothetical protein HKBW3S47_02069, partial [Candidatus Hakubella thermalkaliphila]